MIKYTIDDLKKNNLIIFETVSGSIAYGTNHHDSDTDIRGVFIQPLEHIIAHGYVEQVSDEKNDITYYELRRFLSLLSKNNPNIVELLFSPEDCITKTTDKWKKILKYKNKFLTKLCKETFHGFCRTQFKKSIGYNKKMNWEERDMTKKNVLDFCYVLGDGNSLKFNDWLKKVANYSEFTHEDFGLKTIKNVRDVYSMHLAPYGTKWGIVSNIEHANNVKLTSIPKGNKSQAYLYFNKDEYSIHCRKFSEYQTWLKHRNKSRVDMNKKHGKKYDSKNMMHIFRIMNMALEITEKGDLSVRRSKEEIEELMKIRRGEYDFEVLKNKFEEYSKLIDKKFDESDLPDKVSDELISNLLLEIRKGT